jgi:peptide/nickel transport system ATP-binding protein
VVSEVTEKIAVMYAGKIVEEGPTQAVVTEPLHPYTQGLIKALPGSQKPGETLNQIPGMMPTLTAIPRGCSFHPRCTHASDRCGVDVPPFTESAGHRVACFWRAAQEGAS